MFNEKYSLLDACLRPTNKAWKCAYCGKTLLTTSCIINHKKRCTKQNPLTKKLTKRELEQKKIKAERKKAQDKALTEFKKQNRIRRK